MFATTNSIYFPLYFYVSNTLNINTHITNKPTPKLEKPSPYELFVNRMSTMLKNYKILNNHAQFSE